MNPTNDNTNNENKAVVNNAIESKTPVYGQNYWKGCVGFTFNASNVISKGIAHCTSYDRISDTKISHSLVVVSEHECVEALFDKGVVKEPLSKYFEDSEYAIFFKKPKKITENIADSIVETAISQISTAYDREAIWTLLKEWYRKRTGVVFKDELDGKWICSELAAYCLNEQSEYKGKGILSKELKMITPQGLFEDTEIFTDFNS